MVKLQHYKGKYFISIPKDKVKRKGWKGGEEFDVEFNQDGNLVFVELKLISNQTKKGAIGLKI